jgi:hypothetical protein
LRKTQINLDHWGFDMNTHYVQKTGCTTQFVSGFPGVGKTTYCKEANEGSWGPLGLCIDSDSSHYSWLPELVDGKRVRDPDFPNNYMSHIFDTIGDVETVLISSHEIVRKAMTLNDLPFFLVYPDRDSKKEYIERYVARKSPEGFITLLDKEWDNWITDCENQTGCSHYILRESQYLSDVMHIIKGLV